MMKIEIDIERLEVLGINPNQYVYLYHRYKGFTYSISDNELYDLQNKEYGKLTDNGFELREKAYELFEIKNEEQCWIEFFTNFPLKVPGRNGVNRPLRPKSLDAKESESCKKKYLKIIHNKPYMHKHILKVLDAELALRRQANELQYMNSMDVWLNQNKWEKYEYLIDEKKEKEDVEKYGGKLI